MYIYSLSLHMGVSQNSGYLFGGPHNKDCSTLGSILGSPVLGNDQIQPLEGLCVVLRTMIQDNQSSTLA